MPLKTISLKTSEALVRGTSSRLLNLRDSTIELLPDFVFGKRRVHQQICCHIKPSEMSFERNTADDAARLIIAKRAELAADRFDRFGYLLRCARRGSFIEQFADHRSQPAFRRSRNASLRARLL